MITSTCQSKKLSNYSLPVFKSELTNGKEIRVLGTYDKPLFIAKDIAEILGYKNTKKAIIDHIDEEDKLTCKEAEKSKGNELLPFKIHPQTQLINESGLYSLILRSKLPSAKEFKRWVTSEVLPSIRKTGEYKIQEYQKQITNITDLLKQSKEEIQNKEKEIEIKKKELKKVSKNHESLLKRRKRDKYDPGNGLYLISSDAIDLYHKKPCIKFGIITQTKKTCSAIMNRLSVYNTGSTINYKLHYLIYLKENALLENILKIKYEKYLNSLNKEWVTGVNVEQIIKFIRFITKEIGIKYNEERFKFESESYFDSELEDVKEEIDSEIEFEVLDETTSEESDETTSTSEESSEDEIEEKQDYICKLCNKKYKIEGTFLNHMKNVHNVSIDESTECKICKKIYSSKSKLKRHIDVVHEKKENMKCKFCKKIISGKDNLRAHIKQVHEKSNKVKCNECDKEFSCNGTLTIHIKQVHEKSMVTKCEKCDKSYTTKVGLNNHIKRIHDKIVDNVKCKECNKLIEKRNYKYHLFNIHKKK